jgi:hypothetical protein
VTEPRLVAQAVGQILAMVLRPYRVPPAAEAPPPPAEKPAKVRVLEGGKPRRASANPPAAPGVYPTEDEALCRKQVFMERLGAVQDDAELLDEIEAGTVETT